MNDLNINESCVCVGGACGTRQITGEKDSEDVRPCVCVRVFMHAYMNAIYAHTREYACMEEKKTPICILIRVSVCIHKHLSVSAWSINIHP